MKAKWERGTAAIKEEEIDEEKGRKKESRENSAKLYPDAFQYREWANSKQLFEP